MIGQESAPGDEEVYPEGGTEAQEKGEDLSRRSVGAGVHLGTNVGDEGDTEARRTPFL